MVMLIEISMMTNGIGFGFLDKGSMAGTGVAAR